MKNRTIFYTALMMTAGALLGCASSCSFAPDSSSAQNGNALTGAVTLASWNTQTFFDAVTDGTEFSEFRSPSLGWSKDKYSKRVANLCSVIEQLDADVVVLQEIEKKEIVYDICNNLTLQAVHGKGYPYSCFIKEEGEVFGNMVLSRYPLSNMTVHQSDIQTGSSAQPYLRPIASVTVTPQNPQNNGPFTLYICHWKSKSGGAEETEKWRTAQEQMLADLIHTNGSSRFTACGDFNKTYEEFTPYRSDGQTAQTALQQAVMCGALRQPDIVLMGRHHTVPVFSPWPESNDAGTYYYKDTWEKIDHFFFGSGCEVLKFGTLSSGPHVQASGIPAGYRIKTGIGYSDHLPIICSLK